RGPLFVDCARHHRHLHSFPTRRSSDLRLARGYGEPSVGTGGAVVVGNGSGIVGSGVKMIVPVGGGFGLSEVLLGFVGAVGVIFRSEEHTSELQSRFDLVCRLLLEKKKK